jgi:hypothetical protein
LKRTRDGAAPPKPARTEPVTYGKRKPRGARRRTAPF